MTPHPSNDLALLRSLVKGDKENLERALSDPATEMAGFLRFAHRHQLGAFSYWTLQQLGFTRLLPSRILAAAKASALFERTRRESLQLLLRELGELFDRDGARVLFIKGPLFARRFYGSLEARGLSDLDILLRAPGDLDRIEALLLETGFEPAFRVPISRRFGRYFAHHFEYRRDFLPLDVHWALQRHFTFAIDYERIWATSTSIGLEGRTYGAASDEYELVLQILGVLTDLQVGKLGLRSMVDIYRILKTVKGMLDWDAFFFWRAHERILRPSVYVLALALDVLDCRQEFPTLAQILEPKLHRLPSTSRAFSAVLESRPLGLGQKLLALRLYEAPLAASFAWWLVSLPFRVAVYGVTHRPLRREA